MGQGPSQQDRVHPHRTGSIPAGQGTPRCSHPSPGRTPEGRLTGSGRGCRAGARQLWVQGCSSVAVMGRTCFFKHWPETPNCFPRAHSSGEGSPQCGQRPPTLPLPSARWQGLALRVINLLLRGSSKTFCLAEHPRPCTRLGMGRARGCGQQLRTRVTGMREGSPGRPAAESHTTGQAGCGLQRAKSYRTKLLRGDSSQRAGHKVSTQQPC